MGEVVRVPLTSTSGPAERRHLFASVNTGLVIGASHVLYWMERIPTASLTHRRGACQVELGPLCTLLHRV